MAQKKATIYILNVNKSMSLYPDEAFQKAVDTISCTLQDRALIGRKTDLVSVILCGTKETDNILATETPGQYEHVTALSPLTMTNVDLLKKISNLTPSESSETGDVLDALIVACKMIVLQCRALKYTKQISIFTDAKEEIDWNDLDFVAESLRSNAIDLRVVGIDYGELESPDCSETVRTNYEHWQKLINKSLPDGEESEEITSLEEAYEQTKMIFIKDVRPTPSFRGYLYLGSPELNQHFVPISINTYLRTKEVRLPTSKKVSAISQEGTKRVTMTSKYLVDIADDATSDAREVEIPKENIQKGHKFGKSFLVASEEEFKAGKLKTQPGMSIIGFVEADQFPRHYLYTNAITVLAGAYRPVESATAIAALSQSLFEKNCYAVVRFVVKVDAQPKIGILEPVLDDNAPILQYYDIPYADDLRDYKFRNVKKDETVDNEARDLMEDLVDRMNLDSFGEEYLMPEYNFNPIVQRLNKAIATRALNSESTIPDIDKRFDYQLHLNDIIKAKVDGIDSELAQVFKIKKVVNKGKKKMFAEVAFNTGDEETISISDLISSASEDRPLSNLNPDTSSESRRSTLTIGTSTPIDDYKKLLAEEGDEDNVEVANNLMHDVIFKMMETSFRDQLYPKICDCLEAMRETCAKEDEASTYNRFMHEIKAWIDTSNTETTRYELWKMLKERKLGLITNEECPDTDTKDVTAEVAEKFWKDKEGETFTTNQDKGDESVHDVFDAANLEEMF
ncbi:unnamed protein product [Mucor hiemalis]